MTDHTPTPWHLGSTETTELVMGFRNDIECVVAELMGEIDIGELEVKADAAFIVKAVNNYDALVKHLRHLATVCCDEDALALLDSLRGEVSTASEQSRGSTGD